MERSQEKTGYVRCTYRRATKVAVDISPSTYSINLVGLIAWDHTLFSCLVLVPPDVCNAHQLSGVGGAGSRSGQWGGLELPRLANWKHFVGLGGPAWAG